MYKTSHTYKIITIFLIIVIIFSGIPVSAASAKFDETKIDSNLKEIMETSSNNDIISVSVWFNDIDYKKVVNEANKNLFSVQKETQNALVNNTSYGNFSTENIQLINSEQRKIAKQLYSTHNKEKTASITAKLKDYEIIYESAYAPNVMLNINKSDIYSLTTFDFVDLIYYYEEPVVDNSEIHETEQSSRISNDFVEINDIYEAIEYRDNLTGEGIKIGMTEMYLPSINYESLKNKSNQIHLDPNLYHYNTGYHPTFVASTLIGEAGSSFPGIVPDAELYCTSVKNSTSWKAGIEWLIDNDVDIINISSTLQQTPSGLGNLEMSRWLDHISYQHNTIVVVAAGYFPNAFTSFAYSNNIIIAGALLMSKNDNGVIQYNPEQSSAYSESGVYFPHVVAPTNIGIRAGDTNFGGNSFAAPLTTAALVELMDFNSEIVGNPTLAKSVIMTGANAEKSSANIDASGMDIDRQYGAGVINMQRSINCLSTSSYPKTYTAIHTANNNYETSVYLNITNNGSIRMALNWESQSMFTPDNEHYNSEDSLTYGAFSFYQLKVTSPNGEEYTSFNVSSPFQILSFDVDNNDFGNYLISLSRFGPRNYDTDISLAVLGGEYLYGGG